MDADAQTPTSDEYFAALKTETAEYNLNLTAINTALTENTQAVKDDTAARIQVLEDRKTELEAGAGMTYQEALALYQEKLPANTVALNRLNRDTQDDRYQPHWGTGELYRAGRPLRSRVSVLSMQPIAPMTTEAQQALQKRCSDVDIKTAMRQLCVESEPRRRRFCKPSRRFTHSPQHLAGGRERRDYECRHFWTPAR